MPVISPSRTSPSVPLLAHWGTGNNTEVKSIVTTRILFCPNCDEDREVEIIERVESFPVRGEELEVTAKVAVCLSCKEDVPDERLDDATLRSVYETYRKKYGLLSPQEIAEVRESYGLSQRALARLLGWGEATISRYETGKLPDNGHNLALKNLRDPMYMERLLQTNGDALTDRERERVEGHLRRLGEESLAERVERAVLLSSDRRPTIYNGFRPLDLARLANMIVFFAQRTKLWKTSLMKLLYYADHLHFKRYTVSISGASYARLPNGPILDKYKYLLPALEDEGFFAIRPEETGPYEGDVIYPDVDFDASLFSDIELETMREVAERLAHLSASDISKLSHEEDAWRKVETGGLIPYSYADTLSLTVQ